MRLFFRKRRDTDDEPSHLVRVIMCPPIDYLEYPPDMRALHEQIMIQMERDGTPYDLTPYTGSREDRCTRCRIRIYVGPRQAEAQATVGGVVLCNLCAGLQATTLQADPEARVGIVSLGNPEKDR